MAPGPPPSPGAQGPRATSLGIGTGLCFPGCAHGGPAPPDPRRVGEIGTVNCSLSKPPPASPASRGTQAFPCLRGQRWGPERSPVGPAGRSPPGACALAVPGVVRGPSQPRILSEPSVDDSQSALHVHSRFPGPQSGVGRESCPKTCLPLRPLTALENYLTWEKRSQSVDQNDSIDQEP